MVASFLRLFALRPILAVSILGVPLLVLAAVGLFTIVVLKFVVFFVLPIALLVWLFRKLFGSGDIPPA